MDVVIGIDVATGAVSERPLTGEEQAQRAVDQADIDARQQVANQAETERIDGIVAAQSELHALGLSDAAIVAISGHPYPYAGLD